MVDKGEENEASDLEAIVGEADVTEADLLQVASQLSNSKQRWLVPVAFVAAVTLPLLVLNKGGRGQTLTVILPLVFVVIMVVYFQRGFGRAWVKQALTNLGGPTTYRFDDYGFTVKSSLRQHRLAWAGLARSLETPHAFLVYTTPGTVLIVPKRAFAEDDISTLSALLRERITPVPVQKLGLFGAVSAQRTLLIWVVVLTAFLSIWHFLDEGAPRRGEHNPRENAVQSAEPRAGGEADNE